MINGHRVWLIFIEFLFFYSISCAKTKPETIRMLSEA